MKKYIDKFHFITHESATFSAVSQAQKACEAGGKWIQYRCLDKSETELLEDIHQIAAVCDDWGTTLIVTNHIYLAGKADIQGFHIEDPEADLQAIREQLGDAFTLGASAMNPEGLLKMAKAGADYIGYGPFAPTTTKPNSYPLITLDAYTAGVALLKEKGWDTPLIAVGGIGLDAINAIKNTGVHGLAASAAILQAADFEDAYDAFLR